MISHSAYDELLFAGFSVTYDTLQQNIYSKEVNVALQPVVTVIKRHFGKTFLK